MEIISYLERVTIIWNPDGSIRGGESVQHTGYQKDVPVADAPEDAWSPAGITRTFVVTETAVLPVDPASLADVLPKKLAAMLAETVAQAKLIDDLRHRLTTLNAEHEAGLARADAAEASVADQAVIITALDGDKRQLRADLDEANRAARSAQLALDELREAFEAAKAATSG